MGGAERDRLDPKEPDLSKGILDAIDLDSYRVEKQAMLPWEDADRVTQLITETIPARVAADTAFRNASFKRWLTDTVFALAYEPATTPHTAG